MKVFVKLGLKETVKMWAYCLSNSVLAYVSRSKPPFSEYQESRFWLEYFTRILHPWRTF